MNRDLQKLLKEKWFLVAADFLAVIGILAIGFDTRDGWQATLAFLGIVGASLIVVIPVLLDQGGKSERLAEQARLRAALAAEIDQVRDNARALSESLMRRLGDGELAQQKAMEAAVTNLAQKASSEINSLKLAVAELERKIQSTEKSAKTGQQALEAHEALSEKINALAENMREAVADVDELAEALEAVKTAQAESVQTAGNLGQGLKEEMKKSLARTERSLEKLEEDLEKIQAELREVRELKVAPVVAAPVEVVAPAESVEAPVEVVAEAAQEEVVETAPEEKPARVSRPRSKKKEEVSLEDELPMELIEEAPPAEVLEPAVAGQGTALVINLMIGIGNKPFVRGTGPGLSADKGVPMEFIGIGRWQWVSPEPDAPATVEIWKNDQTPLGEPLHLSGGEPVEINESHFTGG
jgi:hypothetical protein